MFISTETHSLHRRSQAWVAIVFVVDVCRRQCWLIGIKAYGTNILNSGKRFDGMIEKYPIVCNYLSAMSPPAPLHNVTTRWQTNDSIKSVFAFLSHNAHIYPFLLRLAHSPVCLHLTIDCLEDDGDKGDDMWFQEHTRHPVRLLNEHRTHSLSQFR